MSFSIGESILVYTVIFLVSVFFSWIHCQTGRSFFGGLAIFLPTLLSGIRGEYVGTDFKHYLGFSVALEQAEFMFPWDSLWTNIGGGYNMEYGFSLLLWGLSCLFENKTIVFGIIYAMFLCFSYYGCVLLDRYNYCSEIHGKMSMCSRGRGGYAWVGYAVILFSWLIFAFNGLRQYLAISVLFCCIPLFLQRKYLKAGLFFFLALMFHKSAMFALPWVLFCGRKETEVARTILLFFVYVGVVIMFPWIARLAGYGSYLEDGRGSVVLGAILVLPLIVFVFWLPKDRYFYFTSKGVFLLLYTAVVTSLFFYVSRLYAYSEMFIAVIAILLSQASPFRRYALWAWLFVYVVLYRFIYVGVIRCEPLYFELLK